LGAWPHTRKSTGHAKHQRHVTVSFGNNEDHRLHGDGNLSSRIAQHLRRPRRSGRLSSGV